MVHCKGHGSHCRVCPPRPERLLSLVHLVGHSSSRILLDRMQDVAQRTNSYHTTMVKSYTKQSWDKRHKYYCKYQIVEDTPCELGTLTRKQPVSAHHFYLQHPEIRIPWTSHQMQQPGKRQLSSCSLQTINTYLKVIRDQRSASFRLTHLFIRSPCTETGRSPSTALLTSPTPPPCCLRSRRICTSTLRPQNSTPPFTVAPNPQAYHHKQYPRTFLQHYLFQMCLRGATSLVVYPAQPKPPLQ